MSPEARSTLAPSPSIAILGGLVCALGVAIVVGNLVVEPDAVTIVGGAVAVVAGLTGICARLTVVLSESTLRVRFSPFLTVRLSREEVRSARVAPIDPVRLGGVGIRRSRGMRVLTMSAGEGIQLDTTKGMLLVQVTDPRRFAGTINDWVGIDGAP